MKEMFTIPSLGLLRTAKDGSPDYMVPTDMPDAVVGEGFLTDEECDAIIQVGEKEDPYSFGRCGAKTRELEDGVEELHHIKEFGKLINSMWWDFHINDITRSWMQTYKTDGDYQEHTDAAYGQSRKFTAVAFLSDDENYSGGELYIKTMAGNYRVPATRGTIVVFPGWLWHWVTPVTRGKRQTINMGFWGPYFR